MKIGIIVAMGGEFRLVEPLCDLTFGGEGNRLDTMWYR